MKTICLIFLTVLVAIAVADDSSHPTLGAKVHEPVKKEMGPKMTKSTKRYLQAKRACLEKSSGQLKGKLLTECIVNYQKEAK